MMARVTEKRTGRQAAGASFDAEQFMRDWPGDKPLQHFTADLERCRR